MSEKKSLDDGLEWAFGSLRQVRQSSLIALAMPLPLTAGVLGLFSFFMTQWWNDYFVDSILIVFLVGQFLSIRQHVLFLRGSQKVRKVLETLQTMSQVGGEVMIERLRLLPSGHLRDLMLRSSLLLQSAEVGMAQTVLDNAAQRRAMHENRRMGQCISINRLILKLGFLGTLIGLLRTFPPMKEAILALQGSEGQLKFVTDIAKAIDGDHYAIFTTLIATGISLLIELVSLQLMERSFSRFEMVNSHLEEWVLGEGQSLRITPADASDAWSANQNLMQQSTALYQKMAVNLEQLTSLVSRTSSRLEDIREIQDRMEQRVNRMHDLGRQAGEKLQ